MADASPTPLSVAIGESVFTLAARAPGLIRPEQMDDNSPAVVAQPVQLTISVNGQALALPPTRFAQIGQVAGVVTAVDTAPMLDFAELEACNTLAGHLITYARSNGWTVAEIFPPDIEKMKAQLEQTDRRRYEKTYAVLHRGGVSLRIYLKEAAASGLEAMKPPARGRLFLVNTDFGDDALIEARNKQLYARRKQLTGGTQSVPLSAWSERR